jgi:GDPmannose 4,6-dehydratase
VTRKVTRAVANILAGRQKKLYLGNLDAKRDWGFAPEYVEMMWLMVNQDTPDDYVIGTGKSYSIRELVERAFGYMGVEIEWRGQGMSETGVVRSADRKWSHLDASGATLVEIDQRYFRPTEVAYLQADIGKARKKLSWEPRVTFDELIKIMVDYDVQAAGLIPVREGMTVCECKGFDYTNHHVSFHEAIREGH